MSSINKIILALLCIILGVVLVANSAHRHHLKELTASINELSIFDSAIVTLQENIGDLYEAENDFRLYAATYDKSYFLKYSVGLKKIQLSITTFQKEYETPVPVEELDDTASLDETFKKKLAINKMIVDLRRSVDTTLKAALQLDTVTQVDWHPVKDRELVLLNFSLLQSLNRLLHSLQRQQQNEEDFNKKKTVELARHSAEQLSSISSVSFVVIILLLLLTFYNIYRVNLHARKLVAARLEAEKQTLTKSNLLASVSHEIRNPLTVIRGLTELLYDGNLPYPQKEHIRTIRSASDILLSTVNELLDFSKLEAGMMQVQPVPLQPAKLVEEVYEIMKSLAEQKGLILLRETNELPPGLTVRGDAFRLKQVLFNLTSNAIKFTREGQITIRAFSRANQNSVRSDWDTGEHIAVHFEISDTGIGIPPDKIQDIFMEYEQVKQEYGSPIGTGLGLAICQKIVQLHAGHIGVKSQLGKGSVFSVKIDFELIGTHDKPANPAHKKAPGGSWFEESTAGPLKNKRILLVEDNPMVMQLALLLLERQDATVVMAEDGACAWSLFKSHPFDMVITDINLPGINGTLIAKNIRALPDLQKAQIPILALTGDVFAQQIDTYSAAGFDDYIIKPFNRMDFLTKVEKYLTRPLHAQEPL